MKIITLYLFKKNIYLYLNLPNHVMWFHYSVADSSHVHLPNRLWNRLSRRGASSHSHQVSDQEYNLHLYCTFLQKIRQLLLTYSYYFLLITYLSFFTDMHTIGKKGFVYNFRTTVVEATQTTSILTPSAARLAKYNRTRRTSVKQPLTTFLGEVTSRHVTACFSHYFL